MKDLLKNISLFKDLEDSDYEKIAQVVEKGNVPEGTEFCKQGEIGESFFMLVEGEVVVTKEENGQKSVLNVIKASDESNFFGEMALIDGTPRTATITAKTDCVILEIEKKNFDMLLRINSFIALRIMSALSKRLRKTENAVDSLTNGKNAKIISFFSPKGGSGKTSTAINVATGIAKYLKKNVLLIDLDLQFGGIAFLLDLKVHKTISDIAESNQIRSFDDIKETLVKHNSGFSILAAPSKPEQSELVNSNHIRKILAFAKKEFDYILIDTHSLLQDLTINTFDLSDVIALMMTPDMANVKGIHSCLKVMENLKFSSDKIKVILNRDGCLGGMDKDTLESALKHKMDYIIHEDWKSCIKLINDKTTIFDIEGPSDYKSDICNLVSGLTNEKIPEEAYAGGSGFLGAIKKFFSD